MKLEHAKSPEREHLKEKANAWRERYEQALDAVLNDPKVTRMALMDTIWERGILDHLAPIDPEERRARQALEKGVWSRDDHELYLRVLYAATLTEQSALQNRSIASQGYVSGTIFQAYGIMMMRPNDSFKDLFPEVKDGSHENPISILAREIAARAIQTLEKRGGDAMLIPIGAEGMCDDLFVRVTGYTETGDINIEPVRFEDMMNLKRRRVAPTELDPNEFKLPVTST